MNEPKDDLTQRITAAINRGVLQARKIHKALGFPIAIWRDERVQWVDAETLEPVPPPPPADRASA
jgi:hypothetical protein